MKTATALLALFAIGGAPVALGQTALAPLPEIPLAMDEPGPPLGKDAAGAAANLQGGKWRDVGVDLPLAQLSRIAKQPLSEVTAQSRSAKDAQIYRTASPSVVLIAT